MANGSVAPNELRSAAQAVTDFLLKFLGAPAEEAVHITDASLAWRGANAGWILFLIVLAFGAVFWIYRLSPGALSFRRRIVLTALRAGFLGLLLLLFLRPVLSLTVEGSVRRLLVLLIDGSASMRIQDPRLDAADQKRAAIGKGLLAPNRGLDQELTANQKRLVELVPRMALVQSVLKNEALDLLPRLDREFDLATFTFGESLVEMASQKNPLTGNDEQARADKAKIGQFTWVDRLTPDSSVTALGDALREVLNRKRGQPIAGILVMTDGASNSGTQPREAGQYLRQERVPIFAYGVGITSPRDIIVANLFAPEVSFVRDEITVTARVRAQGLRGESGELTLKLGDQIVARQTVDFSTEEQVVSLRFTPQTEGEFELTAALPPRPDETVQDNNARSQPLRVIDTKIKVLMVEQAPRWEFRYLQALLLRDRRVDLKCYLVEGDSGISQGADSPYLPSFPARKEELFKYDLIILGDVDPRILTAAHLQNINELVSRFGGALIMVAGKRWSPHAYRQSLLEKMLPVEFESSATEAHAAALADKPIRLELTAAGKASPMLRLSDQDETNVGLWKQLPPVYWVARVARPKAAAQVLLVDPDPAKESRFGKMPVIAVQQYGVGQVMFVGTDNTWRWRKNVGDQYYTALWGQIAQRVSLQRLLGVSKRTQLTADRQNYITGDRVTIYARLYSAGYEPLQEASVRAYYTLKNGQGARPEVLLRPVPEQAGLYRGEFIAPAPGAYEFLVEPDPEAPLDFNVTEPKFEFGETAMNEGLLRDLAVMSGGQFFREEDLHRVPQMITARAERVRSPLEVELWASPLYFLLLLSVVTAEWIVRKISHLK